MSIILNPDCILCHMKLNVGTARTMGTTAQWEDFTRKLLELYLHIPKEGVSSTWLGPRTEELFREVYGVSGDRFEAEKKFSNLFVMDRYDQIRTKVESAEDPVYAAAQFAVLGNYIDFSALYGEVSFEKLDAMLAQAQTMNLDKDVYAAFCRDLQAGKKLLYLTDNAGEIGFDRIFAEQIQKRYPHVQITFCVRGGITLNDATREDAQAVQLPFPVIDNGNNIAGTVLDQLSPEAKEALDSADLIVAKGQANAETLLDSGYNIYYAFLVKCIRFEERFGKPKLTPMLVRERK